MRLLRQRQADADEADADEANVVVVGMIVDATIDPDGGPFRRLAGELATNWVATRMSMNDGHWLDHLPQQQPKVELPPA